ncbi:MAG: hypothetical protein ACYC3A_03255 [Halothiobacillus sp.]
MLNPAEPRLTRANTVPAKSDGELRFAAKSSAGIQLHNNSVLKQSHMPRALTGKKNIQRNK